IGEAAQVVVGERFCDVVHRFERAQFFAEHEELDQRIGRLLAAERGNVFGLRNALLAMTGETSGPALRDRLGLNRRYEGDQRQQGKRLTHGPLPSLQRFQKWKDREQRAVPGLVVRDAYFAATFDLP